MSDPIRPPVPEEDRTDIPGTAAPAETGVDAAPKEKKKKEKEPSNPSADLYSWLQALTCALVVLAVVFTFVGRIIIVDGHSMDPTLNDKDLILLQCIGYEPKQGDVVVLRKDFADINHPIVKRVIATEGQTVSIDYEAGVVYVDDEPLYEPYLNEPMRWPGSDSMQETEWVIPEGSIFVMGDNRNASSDSRDDRLGPVDTRYVIGHVLCTILPPGHIGAIE